MKENLTIMKKYLKNIVLACLLLPLVACEEYLDKQGQNTDFLTEEDVWSDRDKIQSIADRLYDCTEWFFETRYHWSGGSQGGRQDGEVGKNYGNITILSGEGISLRPIFSNSLLVFGDWHRAVNHTPFGNPDFYMSWEDTWEAIYVSNHILSKIDEVPNSVMAEYDRLQIKGEAFLFRGWAYHEINKRWGAMPYFKAPMLASDDYNLPRPTLAENIEDIVSDLDSATFYLREVSYLDDPVYMGRMGKAAAMALKSRALTTAASPNYQLGNGSDPKMWERAAEAAWEVIELSRTEEKIGLFMEDSDGDGKVDYKRIFSGEKGTIEGLWPRYYAPLTPLRFIHTWLWGATGGSMAISPSQELIDCFETADGWPVHDVRYDAQSGYDDQNPYVNRDPRFYHDILYHGCEWAKTAEGQFIDMTTSPELGEDRTAPEGNGYGNSKTGYLVKKILPEKYSRNSYTDAKYVNSPYIRMAEMYLNYAEAVNEAYKDPKAKSPSADITAVDALNKIRDRVGMAPVRDEFTGDYAQFQERVRNEFYVELCFEYHLWHDQLRWRTAHEYDQYSFHGVKLIEDTTAVTGIRFERFEIYNERHFEDKHYRYPLRDLDLQICDQLEQNPGW